MNLYCPKCGTRLEGDVKFCFSCGFDVSPYVIRQKTAAAADSPVTPPNRPERVSPFPQQPQTIPRTPVQTPSQVSAEKPVAVVAPLKTSKKSKKKKKKRLPFLLRFLIANVIIGAVLFALWFSFGNMVTLHLHSEEVVATLNSGSLDLPGTENAYAELPNYVKDMLDDVYLENEQGPITEAVLPYIEAERVSISGFFGMSRVTYKITAPDLESWLLSLDPTLITSEDKLLSLMEEYIPSAPRRSVEVSVEYDRKNIVSIDWRGNYYTREFADAVCGGFNSAYSTLVEQAMEEYLGGQE